MKKIAIFVLLGIFVLAGCSKEGVKKLQTENSAAASESSEEWNEEWGDKKEAQASYEQQNNHTAVIEKPTGDIVEISEKLFIAQTNDIYLNPEEYLGKEIRYEGIFVSTYYEPEDKTYCYVIRYGPGCCGFDANAGFEVLWDGKVPQVNDWVRATGILEAYKNGEMSFLRVRLSSLEVLDERGAEYVNQ